MEKHGYPKASTKLYSSVAAPHVAKPGTRLFDLARRKSDERRQHLEKVQEDKER